MKDIHPDNYALVAIHEAISALDHVPHDSKVADDCDELTFMLIAIRTKLTPHPFPECIEGAFVDEEKSRRWFKKHSWEQFEDGRLPLQSLP